MSSFASSAYFERDDALRPDRLVSVLFVLRTRAAAVKIEGALLGRNDDQNLGLKIDGLPAFESAYRPMLQLSCARPVPRRPTDTEPRSARFITEKMKTG